MADETTTTTEQGEDLVNTIKDLKATTVARDKYDKDISQLQAERKRLLDIIKSGGEDDSEDSKSIDELRKSLSTSNITNLDFVKNALSLRSKVLETDGGYDIFEAQGHKVDRQLVDGERVANFLQDCVDKADGNSEVFTALMSSNLKDRK